MEKGAISALHLRRNVSCLGASGWGGIVGHCRRVGSGGRIERVRCLLVLNSATSTSSQWHRAHSAGVGADRTSQVSAQVSAQVARRRSHGAGGSAQFSAQVAQCRSCHWVMMMMPLFVLAETINNLPSYTHLGTPAREENTCDDVAIMSRMVS